MNMGSSNIAAFEQEQIDILSTIGNPIAVPENSTMIYDDLKKRIALLKEKEKMIEFFAYSVSHDLKSPATGIYGLTKLLKEKYGEKLDDKGRRYCDQIMSTSHQILILLDKLNAYIFAKETPFSFEKIKIKEIISAVKDEFSLKLREKSISWIESENLPEIVADGIAITRAFRNLVDNALKYGGNGMHELRIEYKEGENNHLFSFSDDGMGIKTKDNPHIFNRFERGNNGNNIEGMGLGLTIVDEIARRHEGCCWVESKAGKGATFHISISKDLKCNKSKKGSS
jgi:signal transduction histidine kinase